MTYFGVFFLLLSFCLCWVVGGGSDITALGVRQCRSFITLPSPPSLPLGLLGNNGRRGCTAREDRCSFSKKNPTPIRCSHLKPRHDRSRLSRSSLAMKVCSGISRLFIFITMHSDCGLKACLSVPKRNPVYCYNEAVLGLNFEGLCRD